MPVRLEPVNYDPFAQQGAPKVKLERVDFNPFEQAPAPRQTATSIPTGPQAVHAGEGEGDTPPKIDFGLADNPLGRAAQKVGEWIYGPHDNMLSRALAEGALVQAPGQMVAMYERLGGGGTIPLDQAGSVSDKRLRALEEREQEQQRLDQQSISPFISRNLRGAATSLTSAVAGGAAGGPYGAILQAVGIQANQATKQANDLGLTGDAKKDYVVREALIEGIPAAAMQAIGLGGLESVVGKNPALRDSVKRGLREGLKRTGITFAEEIPEELATELGHNVNQALSGISPDAMTGENILATIADTTAQTVFAVGAAQSPQLAQGAVESYQDNGRRKSTADLQTELRSTISREQLAKARVATMQGTALWASQNPERALSLLDKENPTQEDFTNANLPEMTEGERKQVLDNIQFIVDNVGEAPQEPTQEPGPVTIDTTEDIAPQRPTFGKPKRQPSIEEQLDEVVAETKRRFGRPDGPTAPIAHRASTIRETMQQLAAPSETQASEPGVSGQAARAGDLASRIDGPTQPATETQAPAPAIPSATPAAIELARRRGVDLATVKGTGKDGRITKPDVANSASSDKQRQESKGIERPTIPEAAAPDARTLTGSAEEDANKTPAQATQPKGRTNATQERLQPENNQPERQGNAGLGAPEETGSRGGAQQRPEVVRPRQGEQAGQVEGPVPAPKFVQSSRANQNNEHTVTVDVAAFDEAWKNDTGYYLGAQGEGKSGVKGRYEAFGNWLVRNPDTPVEMPEVSFDENGVPSFTNGRHRFAWLRDHGVTSIPVTVDETSLKNMPGAIGKTPTNKESLSVQPAQEPTDLAGLAERVRTLRAKKPDSEEYYDAFDALMEEVNKQGTTDDDLFSMLGLDASKKGTISGESFEKRAEGTGERQIKPQTPGRGRGTFKPSQLHNAFPGATITVDNNKWLVTLPNGKTIAVEASDNVPVDIPSIVRFYGVSREQAEQMAQRGVSGATVPRGVQITLSDGRTLTPMEVMVLIDPARADDTTAKHEALHVARELGLFETQEGRRIWNALIAEYGSEEGIATARGEWTKPRGLWERIRQFIIRLMNRLGRSMDPASAMSATFSERFWSQVDAGANRQGIAYQIRDQFDFTSIKNEVVDDLRRRREAVPLESMPSETWQEWLDAADDTLASDPMAGYRLVGQLAKSPRNITPREDALLVIHHRAAYNSYVRVSEEQFDAHDSGDYVRAAELQSQLLAQVSNINKIEEVVRTVGTLAGRALNARKMVLAKDFSLAALVRKAKIKQGGEALSPQQLVELQKLAKQIKDLEARLAEAEAANSGLIEQFNAFHHAEERTRKPSKPEGGQPSKREIALAKLKAAWTAQGNTFVDEIRTNPKFGAKFQIGSEGGQPSHANQVGSPDMQDAANLMAEAYAEMGVTSFGEFWGQVSLHLGNNASQAEGVFRRAWSAIENNPDFVGVEVDATNPANVTREARAIYRRLLEAGMMNRDQNVDIVQQAMPDVLPTREAAMEALSAYGQFSLPSQEEIAQIQRDHNAQLLQLTKLNILEEAKRKAEKWRAEGLSDDQIIQRLAAENLMLKATGPQRDKPTDIVRHLTAQVNEAKREMPISTAARKGQLQTAQDAAKRAVRNRINDLKWEIENRERIVKTKSEMKPDAELQALRKERDILLRAHRQMFPPPGATEAQKNAAAEKAIDRAITELERQLATGDVGPKKPAPKRSTPAIEAKRARLVALRKQRDAIRAAMNPKMTPEQRARQQYIANLRRRISEQKDLLARGDFAPKPKKEKRQLSKEEIDLKYALNKVQKQVGEKMLEYHLSHLSPLGKVGDKMIQVMHLSRAIMTSIDFSAVFRQGGIVAFGHPKLAKGSGVAMFKAFASKQAEFAAAEAIRNDPLGYFAEQSGLEITDDDAKITRQEEAFMGRWGKHVPGVAASERSYSTYLNNLRFALFKNMVENIGRGGRVSPDEAKVIAHYINVATGRGNFLGIKALNTVSANINTVFFAPRWVSSRFEYLVLPLNTVFSKKATPRVKRAIAKEYARTFLGAATFIGTLMAFGFLLADDDKDKPTLETDPRSTDFLKVKIGETRIDPTSGISSAIVFSSRLVAGQTKTASGEVKHFGEGYKASTRASIAGQFLRYKLAPIPGATVTALNDFVDPVGNKQTPLSLAGGLFLPLSVREVRDAMTSQDIPTATALATLVVFGMSSSTYGPATEFLAATPEEREKILEKDLKGITPEDPPLPYSVFMTPEQKAKEDERRYRAINGKSKFGLPKLPGLPKPKL